MITKMQGVVGGLTVSAAAASLLKRDDVIMEVGGTPCMFACVQLAFSSCQDYALTSTCILY